MKNKNVLILGALSDIAKSIAQKYGENGYNLHLAARKIDDLELHSTDLKIRYNVSVHIYEFDLLKTETHKDFIKNLSTKVTFTKPVGPFLCFETIISPNPSSSSFFEYTYFL